MKKDEKTNVMRLLEQKKISYDRHAYDPDSTLTGAQIAEILGEDPAAVYKTLVTEGKPGCHYVFVVPVQAELNLKKAAAAAGEKSIHMIPQKELLPLTGYVHGGCSPIGMKKHFPTYIHQAARDLPRMLVSAGKVGFQVELAPEDLLKTAEASWADLV